MKRILSAGVRGLSITPPFATKPGLERISRTFATKKGMESKGLFMLVTNNEDYRSNSLILEYLHSIISCFPLFLCSCCVSSQYMTFFS